MARKAAPRPAQPKKGTVVLRESDLDDATAAGAGTADKAFKGVDGLNAEIDAIAFQDGDDLFLRKRPGRSK